MIILNNLFKGLLGNNAAGISKSEKPQGFSIFQSILNQMTHQEKNAQSKGKIFPVPLKMALSSDDGEKSDGKIALNIKTKDQLLINLGKINLGNLKDMMGEPPSNTQSDIEINLSQKTAIQAKFVNLESEFLLIDDDKSKANLINYILNNYDELVRQDIIEPIPEIEYMLIQTKFSSMKTGYTEEFEATTEILEHKDNATTDQEPVQTNQQGDSLSGVSNRKNDLHPDLTMSSVFVKSKLEYPGIEPKSQKVYQIDSGKTTELFSFSFQDEKTSNPIIVRELLNKKQVKFTSEIKASPKTENLHNLKVEPAISESPEVPGMMNLIQNETNGITEEFVSGPLNFTANSPLGKDFLKYPMTKESGILEPLAVDGANRFGTRSLGLMKKTLVEELEYMSDQSQSIKIDHIPPKTSGNKQNVQINISKQATNITSLNSDELIVWKEFINNNPDNQIKFYPNTDEVSKITDFMKSQANKIKISGSIEAQNNSLPLKVEILKTGITGNFEVKIPILQANNEQFQNIRINFKMNQWINETLNSDSIPFSYKHLFAAELTQKNSDFLQFSNLPHLSKGYNRNLSNMLSMEALPDSDNLTVKETLSFGLTQMKNAQSQFNHIKIRQYQSMNNSKVDNINHSQKNKSGSSQHIIPEKSNLSVNNKVIRNKPISSGPETQKNNHEPTVRASREKLSSKVNHNDQSVNTLLNKKNGNKANSVVELQKLDSAGKNTTETKNIKIHNQKNNSVQSSEKQSSSNNISKTTTEMNHKPQYQDDQTTRLNQKGVNQTKTAVDSKIPVKKSYDQPKDLKFTVRNEQPKPNQGLAADKRAKNSPVEANRPGNASRQQTSRQNTAPEASSQETILSKKPANSLKQESLRPNIAPKGSPQESLQANRLSKTSLKQPLRANSLSKGSPQDSLQANRLSKRSLKQPLRANSLSKGSPQQNPSQSNVPAGAPQKQPYQENNISDTSENRPLNSNIPKNNISIKLTQEKSVNKQSIEDQNIKGKPKTEHQNQQTKKSEGNLKIDSTKRILNNTKEEMNVENSLNPKSVKTKVNTEKSNPVFEEKNQSKPDVSANSKQADTKNIKIPNSKTDEPIIKKPNMNNNQIKPTETNSSKKNQTENLGIQITDNNDNRNFSQEEITEVNRTVEKNTYSDKNEFNPKSAILNRNRASRPQTQDNNQFAGKPDLNMAQNMQYKEIEKQEFSKNKMNNEEVALKKSTKKPQLAEQRLDKQVEDLNKSLHNQKRHAPESNLKTSEPMKASPEQSDRPVNLSSASNTQQSEYSMKPSQASHATGNEVSLSSNNNVLATENTPTSYLSDTGQLESEPVYKQVYKQININLKNEIKEAVIQLKPEKLGRVFVKLKIQDNQIEFDFKVENKEVQTMIKGSIKELITAFREQNYQVTRSEVSVAGENKSDMNQERESGSQGNQYSRNSSGNNKSSYQQSRKDMQDIIDKWEKAKSGKRFASFA